MLGLSVQKNKSPRSESSGASVTPVKKTPVGRERLKYFVDEIARAHEAIEDLQQRIDRFGSIISDAEAAERALQTAINADGGVALSAYSAGKTRPTDEISRLVALAKSSGEAATAAKIAKPHTEKLLENARSQLITVTAEKQAELKRVIATLADVDVRAYEKSFENTCKLHDSLIGFATIGEDNLGDVHLMHESPKMAKFVALGDATADPFLRHTTSSLTVAESSRRWSEIRSRLEADPETDLSDLMV
jgi:hypothetical protein